MAVGTLYVVATPIGNLDDITLRALSILRSADVILCEDTRVTSKLLQHFTIERPLLSYHQHSDRRKSKEIQALLEEGKNLPYIQTAQQLRTYDYGEMNRLLFDFLDKFTSLTKAK